MKHKKNFKPAESPEPAATVVRRSMRIVSFEPGTAWQLCDQRVAILAALNANRVQIQYDADGWTGIADVSALLPCGLRLRRLPTIRFGTFPLP